MWNTIYDDSIITVRGHEDNDQGNNDIYKKIQEEAGVTHIRDIEHE